MKTIQFNNKEYDIPTEWNDVSIQDQIEVSKIKDEQQHVKILAIISGYGKIPVDELKTVPFHKVENLFSNFTFVKEEIPRVPITGFTHNGEKYYLQEDIFEMKTEDFVAIMTAQENNRENLMEAYPILLAILYRKEGEESLDDYNLDKRVEEFKHLPLPIGYSAYAFFLNSSNLLNRTSQIYSPQSLKFAVSEKFNELSNTLKQSATRSGTKWYIRLQSLITMWYINYLKKSWDKHFNLSPSKNTTIHWWQIYKRLRMMKQKRNQNKSEKD